MFSVEVVRERGAHQHHEDVPGGGQEPQRLRQRATQPTHFAARLVLRRHVDVFYFLKGKKNHLKRLFHFVRTRSFILLIFHKLDHRV